METKTSPSSPENRIAFVIPWYGSEATGGAETLCRTLVTQLAKRGIDIEVLTTCSRQFRSDWNVNSWRPGTYEEDGAIVHRFPVRKRDTAAFDAVNAKLMAGVSVSQEEETIYIREMIRSSSLVTYLKKNHARYRAIIAIPYMFGTTFDAIAVAPEKTYMIPCFHDERYAYMDIFKEPFAQLAGFFFNTEAELRLAERIFHFPSAKMHVMGIGVSAMRGTPGRFAKRYHLSGQFVLYAGRKDAGKNVNELISYFDRYITETGNSLQLVLVGSGRVDIEEEKQNHIVDLGFVTSAEKHDAFADALVLCQPSMNESFSIVLMESWLSKRPVLVHGDCEVTREHMENSRGGLFYRSYEEFREALVYFSTHPQSAARMGRNGAEYVRKNFTHTIVTERYARTLNV